MKWEFKTANAQVGMGALAQLITRLGWTFPEKVETYPYFDELRLAPVRKIFVATWPDKKRCIKIIMVKNGRNQWMAIEALAEEPVLDFIETKHFRLERRGKRLVLKLFLRTGYEPTKEVMTAIEASATPSVSDAFKAYIEAQEFQFEVINKKFTPYEVLWSFDLDRAIDSVSGNYEEIFRQAINNPTPEIWAEVAYKLLITVHITEFSGDYKDAGCCDPINHLLFSVFPDGTMRITDEWKFKQIAAGPVWQIAYRNFSDMATLNIITPGMDFGLYADKVLPRMFPGNPKLDEIFADRGDIKWSEMAMLTQKEIQPCNTHGQCWGYIYHKYLPDGTIEDVPHSDDEEELPYLP